jgi:hypothetical protein
VKGPQFNARVAKANKHADEQIARVMAAMRKADFPEFLIEIHKECARPFCHMVNRAAEENLHPDVVQEAIISLTTGMLGYILSRTLPPVVNPDDLSNTLQSFMNTLGSEISEMVSVQFGDRIAEAPGGTPVPRQQLDS